MSHPTYDQLLPILAHSAQRWTNEFNVDAENEQAVRTILAWSCAHPSYKGDPGKGLLLVGHRGSGKTILLRALSSCLAADLRFTMTNTRKVTSAYNTEGDKGLSMYSANRHMAFDDLGDERQGQHYGDKVEVMSMVIQDRYEHFVDHGTMTHFTTNLTAAEILARYGDRVYSRLKQMVNIVQVGAAVNAIDRRETATAKQRRVQAQETAAASPEAIAEGLAKARGVIGAVKAKMEVAHSKPPFPRVKSPDELRQEALDKFAASIRAKSPEELEEARDLLEKDPNGAALVAIVDGEIERRMTAQAQ